MTTRRKHLYGLRRRAERLRQQARELLRARKQLLRDWQWEDNDEEV